MKVSIETNGNFFWSAEEGGGPQGELIWGRPVGLAVADRKGVWSDQERFTIHFREDGRFGFQSVNGFFLCAELDGSLVFNRREMGGWESFRLVPGAEHEVYGGVAFITDHNTYVNAANQGGGKLIHIAVDSPGYDQTFYPSNKIGQGASGNIGVVKHITRNPKGGLLVDGVPGHVQGVHDGAGFSQSVYNPEESKRRDEISAKAGFMYRRFWWDLDGGYWNGSQQDDRGNFHGHWPTGDRTIFPSKIGRDVYIQKATAYIEQGKSLGLGADVSRGTWTSTDPREMAEIVREIIARVGVQAIVHGQALNENQAVSPHTPISHLTQFRERAYEGVDLRSNSAIGGFDIDAVAVNREQLMATNPGATVIPFHGFRGFQIPSKLERDWNVKYEWGFDWAIDDEGIGNGFFISAQDNMEQCNDAFFKIRTALMLACGYATTLMISPGVIPDDPRSEPWGSSPGFNSVCEVRNWIPPDAGEFQDVFHGGDDREFSPRRLYRAINDTRVEHHLHPDGRFIAIANGKDSARIPKNRAQVVDNDVWIEQDGVIGRVIVGHT
jgi:hypothetical protein